MLNNSAAFRDLYHPYHPFFLVESKEGIMVVDQSDLGAVDKGREREENSIWGGTGGTVPTSGGDHRRKPVPPPGVTGRYRVVRY